MLATPSCEAFPVVAMAHRLRHLATVLQRPSFTQHRLNNPFSLSRRTMSDVPTPAPGKFEWLVVIPDKPGTKEKRLEVRPSHFANLSTYRDNGTIKTGGSYFHTKPESDDPSTWDFAGSTLIAEAASREEVVEILKNDIYTKSGVWDIDNAQIYPTKTAFRRV